ncbi:conserved hypothetical protein [Culex quinquefasciatus]|uniref:Uncharacterized protein n=1 Tax=Culex quinquefasciatus TaxID=7176 RepID=B0XHU9_CULQU|nr:conserved hypothetical protein [Culex quinquefasciatus]|eukprot:XP_001869221.1 conserved hypothetical protein [Culex quinquefasciatus]
MVVQWLEVDGGNLYGRHHVAVGTAQRASYAGASSTIASCGSEGMVWPPTDSRRTLADRHGSFAVRACLGCSGVKHAVACEPDTAEARQAIIDKYCPAFNESVACFDDVLEGVAMCSNDKVSTIKGMYKQMIHNMIDLMCKNNGQLLLEARTPEFRSCLQHVKANVQQCKVSEIIRTRPISQFGEEGCSELKRSKTCIHEQVSSCSSTAYEDIFDAIFQPIADTANCKLNVQPEVTGNEI